MRTRMGDGDDEEMATKQEGQRVPPCPRTREEDTHWNQPMLCLAVVKKEDEGKRCGGHGEGIAAERLPRRELEPRGVKAEGRGQKT